MPEEIRVTEPLDRLAALLMQAPTPICVTRGSTHQVEIMNLAFEAMVGIGGARGRPLGEVAPAFNGAQLRLMDQSLGRGERLEAAEVLIPPSGHRTGGDGGGSGDARPPGERFFHLVYEPLHD